MESPQPSLLAQVAAVGSQFGKTPQALNPVSPLRLGQPQITNATMNTKNILGKNPPRALRVLVAESLLQPMATLERPTASWSDLIPKEPLEDASVVPPTENPLESLLACPLSEMSLQHALSDPLTKETLEHALVSF